MPTSLSTFCGSLGLCEFREAHAGTRCRNNKLDQKEVAPRRLLVCCTSLGTFSLLAPGYTTTYTKKISLHYQIDLGNVSAAISLWDSLFV